MSRWEKFVRSSSLMLTALSTGVLFGTRTAVSPSTRSFTPQTYVEVQQATVRNLRPVMGPLLPAAVLSNVAMVALPVGNRPAARALAVGASLLQLSSLVLTVVYELPINARVLTWSPSAPPRGWEAERDRWEAVHTGRTATAIAGLACLVGATLVEATE